MDGITFYHLAKELDWLLSGGRVDKIQQPERDEIIITLRCPGENRALLLSASADCGRAHITAQKKANPLEPPQLCMLMRKHLIGGRLTSVKQNYSDRVLEFVFEHTDELGDRAKKSIICEFMGKHSNIILVSADGKIMESARHVNESVSSFREVLPGLKYMPPPEHGKIPFDLIDVPALSARLAGKAGELGKLIRDNISGLSLPLGREIAYRVSGDETAVVSDASEYAPRIAAEIADILTNPSPSVTLDGEGNPKELLAFAYKSRSDIKKQSFALLSEATDEFYRLRDARERLGQKSASLTRSVKTNIERLQKKLMLQQEAYDGAARSEEYRIKGEMLSASPHLVKKGMKSVELPNYYDESCALLTVELDEKLNAAANAQRYFKLYKKAQVARKLALEQLESGRKELDYLESVLFILSASPDEAALAEIREELVREGYIKDTASRRQIKALPPSSPLKFTSPDGTEIFVGRNNLQNDRLTFSAQPDEIWLHAKDIPGAHVIIKSASPSDETLLYAATLAAQNSSGATSGAVDVDYTQRKFVKKPSGARPGKVTYSHGRTLRVKTK